MIFILPMDRPTLVRADLENPARPSDEWMVSLGWIDGAVNPPVMYISHEEKEVVWNFWAERLPQFRQLRQAAADAQQSALLTPAQGPTTTSTAPNSSVHYRPHTIYATPSARTNNIEHRNISDPEYSVAVTKTYQIPDTKPASSRGGKTSQPKLISKSDTLPGRTTVTSVDRVTFVNWFLELHQLDDQFAAGVHNGPSFYFWWTGLAKGSRFTIENNTQYESAVNELQKCNSTRPNFRVFVEFEVDSLRGWRIRSKRVADDEPQQDNDQELIQGTAVPSLDNYSHQDQRKGHFIGRLKTLWACSTHKNEGGNPGFCWVDANSNHVGLNMMILEKWAENIVNGEATVKEPPNIAGIETARNGKPSVRPRGRTGPHPRRETLQTAPPAPAPDATTAILLGLVTNQLSRASRSRSRSHHRCKRSRRYSRSPSTSPQLSSNEVPGLVLSLEDCLGDFFTECNIDMRACKDSLDTLLFTPDIIPDVPIDRLCQVTQLAEGHVIKFRKFCADWVARKHREARR